MFSFLDGIRILVISLGYTFPLAIEFQKQEEIGEVYAVAPAFFKHADHGDGFLNGEHVDTCLEVVACSACLRKAGATA